MRESYWGVKLENGGEGKVCLKFWGCFKLSAKHAAYITTVLVALGSALSYLIAFLYR